MKKMMMALLIGLLFLTGCSSKETSNYVKHEVYTDTQLGNGTAEEGYYVRKGKKFYKLFDYGVVEDDAKPYVWFSTEGNKEADIPVLEEEDELVYYSPENRPESPQVYYMDRLENTIGIKFERASTQGEGNISQLEYIKFPKEDYSPDFVSSALQPEGNNRPSVEVENTRITGFIDADKPFPVNVLNPEGFLTKLDSGGHYKIHYLEGTISKSESVKADTAVFLAKDKAGFSIQNFRETNENYFVMDDSAFKDNGYYLVDGGLLMYDKAALRPGE